MGKRATPLFFTLLTVGLACCNGGAGSTGGASTGAGASSGGSTGGSTTSGGSGGTTGSQATSCEIADAGTFDDGAANPDNACQICDPGNSSTNWTSGLVCNPCSNGDGGMGICAAQGVCCTIVCEDSSCKPGGGSCSDASDCCGIITGCS
jgi:hypothetical protein